MAKTETTIKFEHAVIYDGVFYPANTEIKVKAVVKPEKPEKKAVEEHDTRTTRKPKSRAAE